ncbi:MAG TPA: Na+/H+ antiporter subunit E [Candidatus Binatia bacterium]|nr:Na+/H+ antiporter subunit E [Candidatus Binatia bacterium]
MNARTILYFFRYLAILTREVVLASISVAKLVFGPIDRLRSGFVAFEMDARSDIEITVLANSITLTPGTITVHVDPERHILIMHAIDVGHDPEDVRQATKSVLEANILKWSRAASPRRARS